MLKSFFTKRWLVFICCLLFTIASPSLVAANSSQPALAPELINLPNIPFNKYPSVPCTQELQQQFNQQAQIPLSCNIGSFVSAEKLLTVGNFSSFGLTQTSLQEIAKTNGVDLNKIGADQLQNFYGLITPNKLLSDRFGDIYQNQILGKIPLVQEALVQTITDKIKIGDIASLQPLNNLLQQNGLAGGINGLLSGNSLDLNQLRSNISNIALNKVVSLLPDFGNFSFANIPTNILQSFSVANAIPDIVKNPLGSLANVESLVVADLKAIGLPNVSISQLPNPISLVPGFKLGRFDVPLSNDERDLGRQISGGIPDSDEALRKQKCPGKCKFAEITSSITPSYNGSAWVDGENWVPDGFGIVCLVWPGGCRGPAGNNPFGSGMRLLLTNINASRGTAQVAITFPLCRDVFLIGKTCTPSVFPIPSGLPLYTIREGDWLPFVVPKNYADRNASLPPEMIIDRSRSSGDRRLRIMALV
jgi:hypothetical protein